MCWGVCGRRHHPPSENPQGGAAHGNGDQAERSAANARFARVDPIKLPAVSLPDALQVCSQQPCP